jgi:hypothetical protein
MNAGIRTVFALVLGACLPALVQADKQSPMLEMEWDFDNSKAMDDGSSWRKHRLTARLQVVRLDEKNVSMRDSGTRFEKMYNHDEGFDESTETHEKWSNTWSGTASVTGEAMQLDLKLDSRSCTRRKSLNKGALETLPCRDAASTLRFTCRAAQIQLEGVELPQIWAFGRESCVKTRHGMLGLRFVPCTRQP